MRSYTNYSTLLQLYQGLDWSAVAPVGFNWSFCGADQHIGPFRTYGNSFTTLLSSWGGGGLDHRGFKLRWSTDEPRGNLSF